MLANVAEALQQADQLKQQRRVDHCEALLVRVTDRAEKTIEDLERTIAIIDTTPRSGSSLVSRVSKGSQLLKFELKKKQIRVYKERLNEYSQTLLFILSSISL